MRKNYQNREIDTNQPAVPETVSVALDELAADMREGLLALAVGAGLQVLAAIMEADVAAVCGPKGRHDRQRTATRHGHERGAVTLGGRRVPVQRPRMRATDGSGELAVPAYELFSGTEVLGRMAMERMLAGLSTRHYPAGLEPVGARVESSRPRRLPAARRCRGGSSRRPRPRSRSCWLRTCAAWIWWRSWSTGCTSVNTVAWSPWGSTSTGSSTRSYTFDISRTSNS